MGGLCKAAMSDAGFSFETATILTYCFVSLGEIQRYNHSWNGTCWARNGNQRTFLPLAAFDTLSEIDWRFEANVFALAASILISLFSSLIVLYTV
jgi:hypothetical protein